MKSFSEEKKTTSKRVVLLKKSFVFVFFIILVASSIVLADQEQIMQESKEEGLLDVASVPNEKQLEMIELLLTAENELKYLKRENFTDVLIENYVAEMRSMILQKSFSDIMLDISIKYRKSTDERRMRMIEYILPTNGKKSLFGKDYNLLKNISSDFEKRKDELYEIRSLYEFIFEEVNKQFNDTEVVTEDIKKLSEQMAAFYEFWKYDLARETAIKIKVKMDIKSVDKVYEGYKILEEIRSNNFSTDFLTDVYVSAEEEIYVAYFEDILEWDEIQNDTDYIKFIKNIKRNVERKPGDEYVGIDFVSIKGIISQINYTTIQIYRINATFENVYKKLGFYNERGVNTSESTNAYNDALKSFSEERYDEAETLLSKADSSLELGLARLAVTGVLAKESTGFIRKHKFSLSFLIICSIVFGPVLFRRMRLLRVTRKIEDLELENKVLIDLIKKSQDDRFSTGSIDDPTYHIKLDKYMEKISAIKRTLPVLENLKVRYEVPTKIEKVYKQVISKFNIKRDKNEGV
ncbi:hypothetical protein J4208_04570 [Candidatus Woesearchaeota archaeon]|nr:hypothetical protein [Candidatus Woesearchaeota archaeon]